MLVDDAPDCAKTNFNKQTVLLVYCVDSFCHCWLCCEFSTSVDACSFDIHQHCRRVDNSAQTIVVARFCGLTLNIPIPSSYLYGIGAVTGNFHRIAIASNCRCNSFGRQRVIMQGITQLIFSEEGQYILPGSLPIFHKSFRRIQPVFQ